MPLIDTHCHLDFNAFDDDRVDVLHRARQAGLKRIIDPGIDIETCSTILRHCESHEELYAAVGIHPNSAFTWNSKALGILREFARHPKVVAIGEIGLDFYRDRTPKDVQVRVFHEQLALAYELELPVIVHSRKAESETLDILSKWMSQRKNPTSPAGVLHSYSGDEPTAQQAITLGFYIGITGPVTFRNAVQLQHLVIALPLSSLLIETDAPFLTPHPHRGKRNEPAFVRLVAEHIARLKNQPFELVSDITTANAEQLFQWSKG